MLIQSTVRGSNSRSNIDTDSQDIPLKPGTMTWKLTEGDDSTIASFKDTASFMERCGKELDLFKPSLKAEFHYRDNETQQVGSEFDGLVERGLFGAFLGMGLATVTSLMAGEYLPYVYTGAMISGAAVSTVHGYRENITGYAKDKVIEGRVELGQHGQLRFVAGSSPDKPVDLSEFVKAKDAPESEYQPGRAYFERPMEFGYVARDYGEQWWNQVPHRTLEPVYRPTPYD